MIDPRFYRVAAIASFASVLTTLGLIFLPAFFAPGEGFEARMARVNDPAYQLRAWIYLVHPFLVLTAALAIALLLRMRAPVLAIVGFLGFLLWAFTEAGQQTLTLFAFDPWREAYAGADESTHAAIRMLTDIYDGLWNGMYVLLLIGFAVGNLCFGCAFLRVKGLTRIVGLFFLAACALTLALFMGELGFPLPEPIASWSYPAIQPLGRALIGVWLWRESRMA
ncbi:MAG: DUF4386 family protein [Steroidobacteraceae bacterium]|nr:DUF4386 family protein [Steroidobacteraceae bacterium]